MRRWRRKRGCGRRYCRVSAPSLEAPEAFGHIRKRVHVPLVADIHYDYRMLKVIEYGVGAFELIRNIGSMIGFDPWFGLSGWDVPIRIGMNAGSLGKRLLKKYDNEPCAEAMVESAMHHIDILDRLDFRISDQPKGLDIFMTAEAYRALATQIDNPFHLGITEAEGLRSRTIKSAIGLGMLLMDGIGDTPACPWPPIPWRG